MIRSKALKTAASKWWGSLARAPWVSSCLPASFRRPRWPRRFGRWDVLVEEFGELLRHSPAKLFGVDDGHGAPVVARHVVANANGDQLNRRAGLDLLNHVAQMALEIVAGIDR